MGVSANANELVVRCGNSSVNGHSYVAGALDHRVGLEELLVDFDADAGLVERTHAAVRADLPRLRAQLVADLVGHPDGGLELPAVVDRPQELGRDRATYA